MHTFQRGSLHRAVLRHCCRRSRFLLFAPFEKRLCAGAESIVRL
jgi:hypothetical protein